MEARSPSALPEHLLEHAGWLRALARALCRDEHAAADLEQETWLAALRGGAHARDARAWLGSVARRLAASSGRAEGRRSAREADVAGSRPPEAPDGAQTLASVELSARLARAVAELEEPYRTTLALRYYEGLPPRRIAQRLELDERAVESRLRRGREKLRETLDRQCGGREVWFGVAAALALAGSEHGGRGLALAAALTLLLGGGVSGIAFYRAHAEAPQESRVEIDLRDPDDALIAVAAAATAPAVPAEAQEARAAVATVEAGLELVVEGEGTPLVGAYITWRDARGRQEAISDAAGRVRFGSDAGVGELRPVVTATERTRSHQVYVSATAMTRLEIPRRGGGIVGTVVDLAGRPVPSAEVSAWADPGRSPDAGRPERTAITDESGRFALDDMASKHGGLQRWAVAARAGDACTFGRLEGQVDPRVAETEVTLVVEAAWRVRGRVTDPSGRGLSAVSLTAYHAERPTPGSWANAPWRRASTGPGFRTESDAQGAFEFLVVGVGEDFTSGWRLQAESPRHRTVWMELDGPGWIDVVLEWGGRLEGEVLDAALRPVAGARVVLHAHEQREPARTDERGRFAFEGLTDLEGALLAVTAEGHAMSLAVVDLTLDGASQRIVLEPECRLAGSVLGADGRPRAGTLLLLEGDRVIDSAWLPRSRGQTWEDYGIGSRVWCDGVGRFQVAGLYPGRFTVRACRGPTDEPLALAEVELAPGGAAQIELREGCGFERALTLRGSVLDERGAPVEDFTIYALRYLDGETSPMPNPESRSFTQAGGRFELRGLRPARWSLRAYSWSESVRRGGSAGEPQDYAAGVSEIELRLESK